MSKLNERQLEDMYETMIDETNELVEVCGMSYNPSQVLKEVDPTAYRCGFADWLDAEIQAGNIFEKNDEYYDDESDIETDDENDFSLDDEI